MTGLSLETFLRLAQADWGVWLAVAAAVLLLGAALWTGLGSRRGVKRCIAFSVAAHLLLIFVGSGFAIVRQALWPDLDQDPRERIQRIRLDSSLNAETAAIADADAIASPSGAAGKARRRLADWDAPLPAMIAEAERPPIRPQAASLPKSVKEALPELKPENGSGDSATNPPLSSIPAERPDGRRAETASPAASPSQPMETADDSANLSVPKRRVASVRPEDEPAMVLDGPRFRPRPAPSSTTAKAPLPGLQPDPIRDSADPDADVLSRIRNSADRLSAKSGSSTPSPRSEVSGDVRTELTRGLLPDREGRTRRRSIDEVPEVYRSRLDPNRSQLAQRAGASGESELAVERALDWLTRHQDADGRWDGGARRDVEGRTLPNEDSFAIHAAPGEITFGECAYWDADTALTGLALLSYLGAGYTHLEGKHAAAVSKGLKFLIAQQKPDGDLRGPSVVVGMYCHGIAALALSEAYAMTGDPALRRPVRNAIDFIVKAQAPRGQGWRYQPRSSMGDTSVLGWMVLALKSAKVGGIDVPDSTREGALQWLDLVAAGPNRGLAKYQPRTAPTPSMTAEAWVSRQFLGTGGPGPDSDEAARYLLANAPGAGAGSNPKANEFNVYYWYYGTLAMFQRGGSDWEAWNARVRDQLTRRQHRSGGESGSWDPDDTIFGQRGGRIYTTALAALTLEVYYRFLRLYD